MLNFCSLYSGSSGNSLFVETENTKILIGEVESVELSEEFAHEKLSPVLAMYKAKDFTEAVEKAKHLIDDGGLGHTSSLYIVKF